MPLDQLQQIVQDLQRDLKNAFHFVNEQEEELKLQQQTIDELQAKLNQANDNERMNLATELADEQDSYQFLNQTLVGQRQNLREREAILSQHSSVMGRRQGVAQGNGQEDNKIDLEPILVQVEKQLQQQTQELQRLEQEIEQMIARLKQEQEMINNQADKQEMKRQELQSLEQNLRSLQTATAECWGRVNLYQEMLQPSQDSLDGLQQKLEAIASTLEQEKQTASYQLQTIDELRSALLSVMPNPEFAVS
jgi:chromosome segregation ATPase